MESTDIAIVGAGPGGLAAAAEATRAGAQVVLIDENDGPGGQYFRLRRSGVSGPVGPATRTMELKSRLLKEIDSSRLRGLYHTSVWGVFPGEMLALERDGEIDLLKFRRLIVATGAYDRPVAFPGWTLPGVMTAGAAQALVKGSGVLPGRRVLLAGSGPFLLPVAEELAAAGATVVSVLEATRPRAWLPCLARIWGRWEQIAEGYHYMMALRRAGVPVRFARIVKEACGGDRISEVVTVAVDAQWHPLPGTEERLAVDAVGIGYGFLPSTEITRQSGCTHHFDELRGGWLPVHDHEMRTSVPTILVAGEAAGIGGARVAMLQGRIAGVTAARDLDYRDASTTDRRLRTVRAALTHQRAFADVLLDVFRPRPGLLELVTDETLICRCEEIPASQIARYQTAWPSDLRNWKGVARPGMGLCQGRICGRIIAALVARQTGQQEQQLGMPTARPPVKPVSMEALARLDVQAEQYVLSTADQMRMIRDSGHRQDAGGSVSA